MDKSERETRHEKEHLVFQEEKDEETAKETSLKRKSISLWVEFCPLEIPKICRKARSDELQEDSEQYMWEEENKASRTYQIENGEEIEEEIVFQDQSGKAG